MYFCSDQKNQKMGKGHPVIPGGDKKWQKKIELSLG
jgi:hypothetical protein